MSYTLQIANATDRIRSLMKTSYNIPDGNPIILAGEEAQSIQFDKLPMGVIELEGADQGKNNPAVMDLTVTFTLYCWMIRNTDAGADDLKVLRGYLRTMAKALQVDKRLQGSSTYLKLKGFNWSGIGRPWPIDMQSGLQAGYISVEIQVTV